MPDAKRKQKSAVSIIGTGRLGTTLAVALASRGYEIRSLVARTAKSARKAASFLDADVQALAARQLRTLIDADLFLITVPDDQIASVARELSEINADRKKKSTVLHTSGALSSEVLRPLRAKGWRTGSIHPLMSVSAVHDASLDGAYWSVEGDRSAVRLGKEIVRDLGGKSFSIRTEDKPLYHAAAVMVSGNVVALFDVALEMLADCGLDRKTARAVLLPLIASTVRSLQTKSPEESLTGTFSRGDVETVKRHLAVIKNSEIKNLYRMLGERSLRLAQLDKILERQIKKVLLTGLQD
ncbi:MAG: hypothetical protein V7638_4160 [Acidobacteriota bacterium]|jgi:predicted short-subunit dehydrogenase-like oxidoreductase (DUF2520 family)